MRIIILLLLSLSISAQSVNAILGDTSWYYTYGSWPDKSSNENLRISTHLRYVSEKLRYADRQSPIRSKFLDLLDEYIDRGEFPASFSHPDERRPCFIDDEGRLCAVGYLIAQSSGLPAAERINQLFRFHYLLVMEDEELIAWQEASGFSLRELAMIQPTYDWGRPVAPYEVFQDRHSEFYGLKRRSDGKTIIHARFEHLVYTPGEPFMFGYRDSAYYLFRADGKPLNGNAYDKIATIRTPYNTRMIASREEGTELFRGDGSRVWKMEDSHFVNAAGSQFLVEKDGYYGVVAYQGDWLLRPIYKSMEAIFDLDRRPIAWKAWLEEEVNGEWEAPEPGHNPGYQGIIDTSGNLIINHIFRDIEYQRNLYITTDAAGGKRLYNGKGEMLIATGLKKVEDGTCRYCLIIETENGYGHINGYVGQFDIQPKYEEILKIDPHYYRIKGENGYGILNAIGQIVIPDIHQNIFIERERFFVEVNDKWGLYNYQAKSIFAPKFDTLGILMHDGHRNQRYSLLFAELNGKYLIKGEDGQMIHPAHEWDDYKKLSSSTANLTKDGKTFLLQYYNGQVNYHPSPLESARFLNPVMMAYRKNGKEGLWRNNYYEPFDSSHLRPAIFDTVFLAERKDYDKIVVQKDGLWGVYSYQADSMIIPCEYDTYHPLDRHDHSGWIYFRKDGIWWGYFYTTYYLHAQSERTQKGLSEEWRKERGIDK